MPKSTLAQIDRDRLTGKSPFHPAQSAGFGQCHQ